jgi:hypothetical protein
MFNVGFSWIPEGSLEGVQIDLDYYDYEYEDIIGREGFAGVLAGDEALLNAAIAGGQTLTEAIGAGVGNRDQVVRNGAGIVVRVLPDFLNLSNATISGIDLQASYSFDTDYGALTAPMTDLVSITKPTLSRHVVLIPSSRSIRR